MNCSFCSSELRVGVGKKFVKTDGTIFHFCKAKCEKNMFKLKRNPKKVGWVKKVKKVGVKK